MYLFIANTHVHSHSIQFTMDMKGNVIVSKKQKQSNMVDLKKEEEEDCAVFLLPDACFCSSCKKDFAMMMTDTIIPIYHRKP